MCHIWVEFREIEYASKQEDRDADRAELSVSERLALGGLEQSILSDHGEPATGGGIDANGQQS
jgi:hypothetical protein